MILSHNYIDTETGQTVFSGEFLPPNTNQIYSRTYPLTFAQQKARLEAIPNDPEVNLGIIGDNKDTLTPSQNTPDDLRN